MKSRNRSNNKKMTTTQTILDKYLINIGAILFVVSDVLSFWLRMWVNRTRDIYIDIDNYSISNNVYHFGMKLAVIIIITHCFFRLKTIPLLISLLYTSLSFVLYGIDEIMDILSKTNWSINILIISTIVSYIWYFVKR